MEIKAVIFDLDGVIVSTDEYHYRCWKRLADEEGIYFNRDINHCLRGVSRMESLEILLKRAEKNYSNEQKFDLAEQKNSYYCQLLNNLSPSDILPNVMSLLTELKKCKIKVAVASSSKNTPLILEQIGLANHFDAIADGNDIQNSKPDPEVFLLAAERLGIPPSLSLVIEDAEAGVEAAIAGGMRCLAVGAAQKHPDAWMSAKSLASVHINQISQMF